jgi:hypothetical protein
MGMGRLWQVAYGRDPYTSAYGVSTGWHPQLNCKAGHMFVTFSVCKIISVQREIVQFCFRLGKTTGELHKMLVAACRSNTDKTVLMLIVFFSMERIVHSETLLPESDG